MRLPLIYGACLTAALSLAACAPETAQDQSSATPAPTPSAVVANPEASPAAKPSAALAPATPAPGTPAPSAPASLVPTTSPVQTAAPAEAPAATATPAPATPAPASTPSPAPVAPPQLAPNAPPQIVKLDISSTMVHPGDTVSGDIVTSSNVASVEARIANFSIDVPKVGEGRFALRYTVPNVPFFLRRTYTMDVIARNTAGAQVRRSVPITIR